MVLPRTIDPSPHDPLLLRPLPPSLPSDPSALVSELASQLHTFIDAEGDVDPILLNTLSAGVRHATRSAQTTVNAGRVHSAEARAGLDAADAELRAVMYELGKVREAIAECDAYVPEYEKLDLVPEDDFLASVEQEVLAGLREYFPSFPIFVTSSSRDYHTSCGFCDQADTQPQTSRRNTTPLPSSVLNPSSQPSWRAKGSSPT